MPAWQKWWRVIWLLLLLSHDNDPLGGLVYRGIGIANLCQNSCLEPTAVTSVLTGWMNRI